MSEQQPPDAQGVDPHPNQECPSTLDALSPSGDPTSLARRALRARLGARLFPNTHDEPPPAIGRFSILRRIGAGGMGEVYEALDPTLERRVAIKTLHQGLGTRHRDRLRREATALARLSHPNVVHVYEVEELDDGTLYLVMEFVDGLTLEAWRQSDPPWRDLLCKYVDAGRALAAAHAARIIHRDFKPGNVMLRTDGRVAVLDFGLACSFSEVESLDGEFDHSQLDQSVLRHRLTITGAAIGTPAYMAPEQMAGSTIGPRADQFSFCASLWEAMYGVRPFSGDDPSEVLQAAATGHFRPLPHDHRRPAWLYHVLRQGLQANPDDRFSSMEQLLQRLESGQQCRSRRLRWGAALATLGVGVTTSAFYFGAVDSCQPAQERLEALIGPQVVEARKDAFLALGAPQYDTAFTKAEHRLQAYLGTWSDRYRRACQLPAKHRGTLEERTCLERSYERAKHLAGLLNEPQLEILERLPWILPQFETISCESGANLSPELERALLRIDLLIASANYDEATELGETLLAQYTGPAQGWIHHRIGASFTARRSSPFRGGFEGERERAQHHLEEALRWALRTNDRSLLIDVWLELAELNLYDRMNFGQIRLWLNQAETLIEQIDPPHSPRIFRLELLRAQLQSSQSQLPEAVQTLDALIPAMRSVLGTDTSMLSRAYRRRADIYVKLADYRAARRDYNISTQIHQQLYGDQHPLTLVDLYPLAVVDAHESLLDDAAARLNHMKRELQPATRFPFIHGLVELQLAYIATTRDQPQQALDHLQRAEHHCHGIVPQHHHIRDAIARLRADALFELGRYDEATNLLRAQAIALEARNEWDEGLAARKKLADSLITVDRLAAAQHEIDDAFDILHENPGPGVVSVANLYGVQARLNILRGQTGPDNTAFVEARRLLETAPPSQRKKKAHRWFASLEAMEAKHLATTKQPSQ